MMKIVSRYTVIPFTRQSTKTGTWLASFSSATSIRTMASRAKYSEGSDEASLSKQLESLSSSRWSVTKDGHAIERSFKFKTFAKTWDFMTAVSLQCKLKNHHPEWSNVYNTTFIRWTTHSPPGLSAKDTALAAICDSLAQDFGEIQETSSGEGSCHLEGLADAAAATSGDCCTPKK